MQLIREFDSIHDEARGSHIELWENLVSTIYDLAQRETSAAIVSMIDGLLRRYIHIGTCIVGFKHQGYVGQPSIIMLHC